MRPMDGRVTKPTAQAIPIGELRLNPASGALVEIGRRQIVGVLASVATPAFMLDKPIVSVARFHPPTEQDQLPHLIAEQLIIRTGPNVLQRVAVQIAGSVSV